jgi:thiosulfate/3-mercaptopyruvate sulfurtransferase
MISNFINHKVLHADLLARKDFQIVDTRFDFLDADRGRRDYLSGHIPGAKHLQLEWDFSAQPVHHGGRHPLPDKGQFLAILAATGIDLRRPLVLYDYDFPANAARLWWMLTFWLGWRHVLILDGGMRVWREAALPLSSEAPANEDEVDIASCQEQPQCYVDMNALVALRDEKVHVALVDAREPERFLAQREPIDKEAGHIPGAINFFWQSAFSNDGKLLPAGSLEQCLGNLAHFDEVIVYCGSGVTACSVILALDELGHRGARLYPGGWSDWISYPELPRVPAK